MQQRERERKRTYSHYTTRIVMKCKANTTRYLCTYTYGFKMYNDYVYMRFVSIKTVVWFECVLGKRRHTQWETHRTKHRLYIFVACYVPVRWTQYFSFVIYFVLSLQTTQMRDICSNECVRSIAAAAACGFIAWRPSLSTTIREQSPDQRLRGGCGRVWSSSVWRRSADNAWMKIPGRDREPQIRTHITVGLCRRLLLSSSLSSSWSKSGGRCHARYVPCVLCGVWFFFIRAHVIGL